MLLQALVDSIDSTADRLRRLFNTDFDDQSEVFRMQMAASARVLGWVRTWEQRRKYLKLKEAKLRSVMRRRIDTVDTVQNG